MQGLPAPSLTLWSPHLTIPAGLQAAPVHPLLTVGALEPRRAVADVGRVGVCTSHTQAAIETRSISTCHPAHLTLQPVKPAGTGAFEGPGCLLGKIKRTRLRSPWSKIPPPSLVLTMGAAPCQIPPPSMQGPHLESPPKTCPSIPCFCVCPANPTGRRLWRPRGNPFPTLLLCLPNAACLVCPPQFRLHSLSHFELLALSPPPPWSLPWISLS